MVTTNLLHFLQQFCTVVLSDTPWIWIDAMGINKLDLQERAAQVNMMGRIYTSCAEVIIWLGIGTVETQHVFEIMPTLFRIPQGVWNGIFHSLMATHFLLDGQQLESMKRLIQQGLPEPGQLVCKAFIHLLRRSWFHRIWTVQECLLPSRGQIWCGSDRMESLNRLPTLGDLAHFYAFISVRSVEIRKDLRTQNELNLKNVIGFLRDFLTTFKNVATEGQPQTKLRSPAICISSFMGKQCSDPRDPIYGTLGLQDTPLFQADYNISVQELFTQVTLHPAMSDFLLSNCEDESIRTTLDLPSWVSDWSSLMFPTPWTWQRGCNVYCTGVGVGDNEGIVCEPTSGGVLKVEGFEEDEIAFLGGSYQQTIGGDGILTSLAVLKLAYTKLETLRSKPKLVECFSRTLIANLGNYDSQHPSSELHSVSFRNYVHVLLAYYLNGLDCSDHTRQTTRATLDYFHVLDLTVHLPLWKDIVYGMEYFEVNSEALNNGSEYATSMDKMFHC
jgi:hypothetical protein